MKSDLRVGMWVCNYCDVGNAFHRIGCCLLVDPCVHDQLSHFHRATGFLCCVYTLTHGTANRRPEYIDCCDDFRRVYVAKHCYHRFYDTIPVESPVTKRISIICVRLSYICPNSRIKTKLEMYKKGRPPCHVQIAEYSLAVQNHCRDV